MHPGVGYRSERTIGAFGAVWGGLNLPVDVSVGPSGRLFFVIRGHSSMNGTAEAGTQDQIAANQIRVNIWSLDDDKLGAFGKSGWGDGELVWPSSVATDDQERVYVTDEGRHDIQVFDNGGTLLHQWGGFGSGPGRFNRPAGVAVLPDGAILVSDCLNHRIQKLGPDGQPLAAWGSHGAGPGELDQPWGLTVDHAGNVYVADWGNDRVQKLSPAGKHLATFGSEGPGPARLRHPSSVAVDGDGDVYVADTGNKRVLVFTPDGALRTTLTGDAHLSKHGVRYYRNFPQFWDGVGNDIPYTKVPSLRDEERHFVRPTSVKIDAQGRLLVVDSSRHRVQVFEKISPRPSVAGSALLTYFVRAWTDLVDGADRDRLSTYRSRAESASGSEADEARRAWLATDWLIRSLTPVWLDLAGLTADAKRLRELAEVTAPDQAERAMPIVGAVRDAAENAAVHTDWAPAPRAAWDAAKAVAWPATRFAPDESLAAAARDAAGAAAFAAKPDPLVAWPSKTLDSAASLLERMLAVGKTEALR